MILFVTVVPKYSNFFPFSKGLSSFVSYDFVLLSGDETQPCHWTLFNVHKLQ